MALKVFDKLQMRYILRKLSSKFAIYRFSNSRDLHIRVEELFEIELQGEIVKATVFLYELRHLYTAALYVKTYLTLSFFKYIRVQSCFSGLSRQT